MRVTVRQLKRLIKEAVAEAMDEGPLELDKPTVLAMLNRVVDTQSDEVVKLNKQLENGRVVMYKFPNGKTKQLSSIHVTSDDTIKLEYTNGVKDSLGSWLSDNTASEYDVNGNRAASQF